MANTDTKIIERRGWSPDEDQLIMDRLDKNESIWKISRDAEVQETLGRTERSIDSRARLLRRKQEPAEATAESTA